MRVLLLAGLFTAATAPFAVASEDVIACQGEDIRRTRAEQRLDAPAPAPAPVRPAAEQREAADAARPAASDRRRGGKPVPDARLMSPRGVL
ncbi:MAG: hypothetical protein A4S17_09235 [Proteobacteria bacterium HN_bin10]|jgi:hypothetical protein|nr:MAG: hypothetical protein A4S17_09235 [Proteobacteria bacterium HN_bin10]